MGQENATYKMTFDDRRNIQKSSYNKKLERFGEYLIPGLVIPYIDSDETILKFLLLNRASNKCLKHCLYKHALLKC